MIIYVYHISSILSLICNSCVSYIPQLQYISYITTPIQFPLNPNTSP